MKKTNTQQGFVREIVIIAMAVLFLNYIGFDVKEFLDSPEVKDAFQTTLDFLKTVWISYIKGPALYVWNVIIVGFIWEGFIQQFFNK